MKVADLLALDELAAECLEARDMIRRDARAHQAVAAAWEPAPYRPDPEGE